MWKGGFLLAGVLGCVVLGTAGCEFIRSDAHEVSFVVVSPKTVTVAQGGTVVFSAEVGGVDGPSQEVSWSIDESDKQPKTIIPSRGRLRVSTEETLPTLTIRATSVEDPSKSGTATATIIPGVGPQYVVTFDSRGGSEVEEQVVLPGAAVAQPEEPLWSGWFFEGWYESAAYDGGEFSGSAWDFAVERVTEDITLYAKWRPAKSVCVAASSIYSFILLDNGSLWAAGCNESGELGLGETKPKVTRQTPFVQVVDSGVAAVAPGFQHTLILKEDGSVWATGENGQGDFGTEEAAASASFMQVAPEAVAVAAGYNFSFLLKADGSLWASGANYWGQLGTGDTEERKTWTQVVASGVTAVSAGYNSTLILKEDGSVWAVGANHDGQLGTGDTTHIVSWTRVVAPGTPRVTAVFTSLTETTGKRFSLCLKEDGSVWGAGNTSDGQLGSADAVTRLAFTRIFEPDGAEEEVTALAATGGFSLLLKRDGSVWAAGDNAHGQLGLGDKESRAAFIRAAEPETARALAAGWYHSLILTEDGSVLASGYNASGQLGVGSGDFEDRSAFTQVWPRP